MAPPPAVSVVIRARDEGRSIARTLSLLRRQVLDPPGLEIIVVDSGSSDATVALARDAGARIVEIAPESFSFGGALNRGCAEARGELLVALSAHAFPPDHDWLARMVGAFGDSSAACAFGPTHRWDGTPLREVVRQDAALALLRVDPTLRFAEPHCRLPVDLADVVAGLIGANLLEVKSPPAQARPVTPRE